MSTSQSGFFGGFTDQNMRVSDAERQEIADRLAAHFADGRLDQAEFDERVGQAMAAKTRADLRGVLADLPEPGPAGAPRATGGPVRYRRRSRHPILLVALIVFVTLAFAHEAFWFFVPWLWLGVIFVAALALTGRVGRSRAR